VGGGFGAIFMPNKVKKKIKLRDDFYCMGGEGMGL
jgi:hypothetical protein